jgi:uncharacterized alkaline shock family protein YloU
VSDFPAESNTVQGGPGPFAPPQDDDAGGPAPAHSPARGANGTGPAAGPGAFGTGAGPAPAAFPGNGAAGPASGAGPAAPGTPANPGAAGIADGGPRGPSGPAGGPGRLGPVVKGRIEVADEVVEKVAALAAIEVEGVADLGGDFERALESVRERIGIGQKRGDQGVKARITGREVTVDVVVMVEYGHVVMDVARQVQTNVAVQTNRMLGLNVVEVNVTVDDVKLPEPAKPEAPAYDERQYLPQPDGYAG